MKKTFIIIFLLLFSLRTFASYVLIPMDAESQKQHNEQAETRKSLVGSGDRSERIRTYNFPQGRVSDHRINLTLYKLDEIISGNLVQMIEPLINEYQADQLVALSED